jgi:hypothetical protein
MTLGFALLAIFLAAAAAILVAAPLVRPRRAALDDPPRPERGPGRPARLIVIAAGATALIVAAAVITAGRAQPGPPSAAPGASRGATQQAPRSATEAGAPSGQSLVEGVVVNGTTGAPADGVLVILRALGADGGGAERRAAADSGGRFRFAEAMEAGTPYELVVAHGGVSYRSGAFRPDDLTTPVELRVYDATDRDPGLRVDRAALVVAGVDARRREVVAHEIVTLVNPSTQTYVPGPVGGPMGLVRFSLPPGARDLTPTMGLRPEELVQVDRGFAVLAAVLPGSHEYGFSYRFPYEPGVYAFALAWPYGARALRVLAPPDGPVIGGPLFRPDGGTELGGQPYRAWAADDVPPDGRVALELRGLPSPPLVLVLVDAVARPWAAALVLAGALLLAAGWRLLPQGPGPPRRSRPLPRNGGPPRRNGARAGGRVHPPAEPTVRAAPTAAAPRPSR